MFKRKTLNMGVLDNRGYLYAKLKKDIKTAHKLMMKGDYMLNDSLEIKCNLKNQVVIKHLEEETVSSLYNYDDINIKYQISEIRKFINSDKVSKSILDYNKRKIANEIYLQYLVQLNDEGLVKYKGKRIEKLFHNIKVSGNYIQFGYDQSTKRMKVLNQFIEQHTLAPLNELSKSRKNAIKVATMINYISKESSSELYFVTLTIPNVSIDQLAESIVLMNKNFRSITTNKKYKTFETSYIKKIESTYNDSTGEGHPHFHFIFKCNRGEIDEFYEYLLKMWIKKYPKANRAAQNLKELDLSNPLKAAQEVATYTAKSSNYLNHGYEVFKNFYRAFTGKSNLTFNGFFKELHKMYKLKELEDYVPDEFKEAINITHIIEMRWDNEKLKYIIKIGEVNNFDSINEQISEVLKL